MSFALYATHLYLEPPEEKLVIKSRSIAAGYKTRPCDKQFLKKDSIMKPTLSLCMIVKNEENLLPRCLDSAKDIVDEIIIVDTGSTDNTIQIAQQYGAKVHIHPWENDFSKHRNQSISYASSEWILYLDADEELIPPSGQIIKNAIQNQSIDSIAVQIINPFNNGKNQAVFNAVRIFKKHVRFEGIVHNRETGCVNTLFYPVRILHHGYNLNIEKTKVKFARTSSLLKEQIHQDPDNPLPHHYLSASYLSMGVFEQDYFHKAVHEGMKAIHLAKEQQNGDPIFLCSHYIVAASHLNLGNIVDAEALCKKALDIFPDHLDSYFLLAKIYDRKGEILLGKKSAERYLAVHDEITNNPGKFGRLINNSYWGRWLIKIFLGKIIYEEGEIQKAHRMFKEAIENAKENAESYRLIGEFFLRKAVFHEAVAHLEQATRVQEDQLTLYMLMESYGQLWDVDNQINILKKIIKAFPQEIDNINRIGLVQFERLNYKLANFCLEKAVEMGRKTPENLLKLNHARDILRRIDQTKRTNIDSPPSISACLMVKNEEVFLGNCLKSIKPHVDEIIVVDTGSTDKTVEIAKGYGAKVYHHPWEGDFSKHRNQSISYARGDWILVIDADEVLERESAEFLRGIVNNTLKNALLIKEINCTKSGELRSVFGFPRIFRNFMGCHYRGIVHNQPYFPGEAEPTPITFFHFGYDQTPGKMAEKRKRTIDLLEKQIMQEPDALFPRFNLAISRFGAGDYAEAVKQGSKTIELLKKYRIRDPGYGTIYYITGMALLYMDQIDQAEQTAKEGIQFYPENMDAYFVLTLVYDRQNDHLNTTKFGEGFLQLYRRILDAHVIFNIEYRTIGGAWNIMLVLSLAYFQMGQWDQSHLYFQEACRVASLDAFPQLERDRMAKTIQYGTTHSSTA
ncbi:MAG: glycosyltransferase [Deltaproteobacteria bacterium]|nr:glycosyltransferase [Deltaproteobacteria bacterium]